MTGWTKTLIRIEKKRKEKEVTPLLLKGCISQEHVTTWLYRIHVLSFISLFVYLYSGPSTSSQPAQQQLENGQGSSLTPTPSSQPSSTDSPSPHSPQPSPQFSPSSQLSDLTSDGPPVDSADSLGPSSAPHLDPQGSSTGVEEEVVKVDEAKEVKNNKKQHLHCPTCKVTVNSSSQLEAHCSGMYYNITVLKLTLISRLLILTSDRLNQALSTNRCWTARPAVSHNAGSRQRHCPDQPAGLGSEWAARPEQLWV